MVSCNLDTPLGKLPTSSPLDLTLPDRSQLFLWAPPPSDYSRGDLWIDYPFSQSYNSLGPNSANPELATDVRSRLIGYVDEIIAEASGAEINEQKAKWAVTELLTNATQYARLSENNDRAGLIRLEWRITRDKSAPSLALAISNPCPTLFDPTRYALMSIADFYSMEPSTTNGHLGTIALVGYLQPHSHLSYVWELPNEERISCALQLIQESDSDKPLNFEEIMKPVRVGVAKFGPHNEPLSYSREDFYRDVQNGLRTRTVSVSCII